MDDTQTPANSNLSLSHFTKNKNREITKGHVDQLISLMQQAEIPRVMISETLFEKLIKLIVPKGQLTSQNATIWYSQLLRMKDVLQNHITMIEVELDRTKTK